MINIEYLHNSIQKFLTDLYPSIPVYHSTNSSLASDKNFFITWDFKETNFDDFNKPDVTILVNFNHKFTYNAALNVSKEITKLLAALVPQLNVVIYDDNLNKVGSLVCLGFSKIQHIVDNNFLMQPVVVNCGYVQTI